MRTTLDLDEDLIAYLREQADDTGRSTGEIASELMRQALERPGKQRTHTEFPTFTRPPGQNVVVTMELVNKLRDESA
jgi:negative regulator of replication initiation